MVSGGGSQANLSARTASRNSGQYSWQPDTVSTRGSMIRSVIGKSISTIWGISVSRANMRRSSELTGISPSAIVRPMSRVLYFFASGGTDARRSALQSVELMIGCALVTVWQAASTAARLVVSRHRGRSVTFSAS